MGALARIPGPRGPEPYAEVVTVDGETELWREPEQREKEGGRAVLFLLLVLAALAGGAYVAAYLAAGDKVPRGTTVAGVEVGGHTPGGRGRPARAQARRPPSTRRSR